MRIRVREDIVRTIDEIKKDMPDLYRQILNRYRDFNVDYDSWCDYIKDDFIVDALNQGFAVDNIYWSGFSSQGDGAMFEGNCDVKKFILFAKDKIFKDCHSSDKDIPDKILHWLETGEIQDTKRFKHHGHYCHYKSYRTDGLAYDFNVCDDSDADQDNTPEMFRYTPSDVAENEAKVSQLESIIDEWYESLCKQLYKQLEDAYESMTTDESVHEALVSNEYEFDEKGKII